jgi:hypothetical protein
LPTATVTLPFSARGNRIGGEGQVPLHAFEVSDRAGGPTGRRARPAGVVPPVDLVLHRPADGTAVGPQSPHRFGMTLRNRSGRTLDLVLQAEGTGRTAVRLPVQRCRLEPAERLDLEAAIVPHAGLAPGDYQVYLRVRAEGVPTPVTAPVPFTVIPQAQVRTEVMSGPDASGALPLRVVNTGNVDLEVSLASSVPDLDLPVRPERLTIARGAAGLVWVGPLPRRLRSRVEDVRLDLVDPRHGRQTRRHAVRLPGWLSLP